MVEETPPTSERQSPSETIEVEPATSNCSGRTFDAKSTSQTNEPTAYIRALTPAPVPHKTCALELPVYISGFKAVLSVKIHLPVLDPFDPASDSIFNITNYLTAFGWSPSSSESIQTECRELLRSLARIAKELIPIVRDKAAKSFLVLLSRLGQQVFLKRGMPVELCGLGMTKAVVQHEGNVKMIGFNQIAKLSSTG